MGLPLIEGMHNSNAYSQSLQLSHARIFLKTAFAYSLLPWAAKHSAFARSWTCRLDPIPSKLQLADEFMLELDSVCAVQT